MTFSIIYLAAVLIGVFVTIVPIMNGANTRVLGTFRVSFYHFLAAWVTGLVFLFFTTPLRLVQKLPDAPIHYFFGGILGLLVILLMNYYTVRIKAMHIAILPFLGQMTMGLLLDYFLFSKMDVKTIVGLVIVLLGLWIQSGKTSITNKTHTNPPL